MNFGPFFLGIFAAVLFANLTTLGLLALIQGGPHLEFLNKLEQVLTVGDRSREHQSGDGLIDVTFRNTSNEELRCSIRPYAEFIPFLSIKSGGEKRFDGFKAGTRARCSIFFDGGAYSTILTYFVIDKAGVYDILLERVHCDTCKNRTWRWATVVVDPSGHPEHSRYRQ